MMQPNAPGAWWKHVPSPDDERYNERETALAIERGGYGYRWCTRGKVPAEYDLDSLESRHIQLAAADRIRNKLLRDRDGGLLETTSVTVYRVPLEPPMAIGLHQADRAQEILDTLRAMDVPAPAMPIAPPTMPRDEPSDPTPPSLTDPAPSALPSANGEVIPR